MMQKAKRSKTGRVDRDSEEYRRGAGAWNARFDFVKNIRAMVKNSDSYFQESYDSTYAALEATRLAYGTSLEIKRVEKAPKSFIYQVWLDGSMHGEFEKARGGKYPVYNFYADGVGLVRIPAYWQDGACKFMECSVIEQMPRCFIAFEFALRLAESEWLNPDAHTPAPQYSAKEIEEARQAVFFENAARSKELASVKPSDFRVVDGVRRYSVSIDLSFDGHQLLLKAAQKAGAFRMHDQLSGMEVCAALHHVIEHALKESRQ